MNDNPIITETDKTSREIEHDINHYQDLYNSLENSETPGDKDQRTYSAAMVAKRYYQLYQKTRNKKALEENAKWLITAYNEGSGYACHTLANAICYQSKDQNKRYQIGALKKIDISPNNTGYKKLMNEALDKHYGGAYNDLRLALRYKDDPDSALRIDILEERGFSIDKASEYKFLFIAALDRNLNAAENVCKKYFGREGKHSEKLLHYLEENKIDVEPFIKKSLEIAQSGKKYNREILPAVYEHFQETYASITNKQQSFNTGNTKMRLIYG